ncbi:MAG: NusA-like transcription termination signal-binding factor [Nanoarchaeota archaeon]
MKLDVKLIGYVNLFEQLTKVNVKDCFIDDDMVLVFVVNSAGIGKAVGKDGINVKKLSGKLKQKLRVIGFDDDPCNFVKNLLYPLSGFDVSLVDDKVLIRTEDRTLKGKIYGRDKSNLIKINGILRKYFKDLKIVVE